mmetsp:Transcript_4064/g.13111  ORF Transcript_4064/g.13111 Transcript_4064/m.13111 type:complete len:265 (+) Transcript_4064:363-1157(+)
MTRAAPPCPPARLRLARPRRHAAAASSAKPNATPTPSEAEARPALSSGAAPSSGPWARATSQRQRYSPPQPMSTHPSPGPNRRAQSSSKPPHWFGSPRDQARKSDSHPPARHKSQPAAASPRKPLSAEGSWKRPDQVQQDWSLPKSPMNGSGQRQQPSPTWPEVARRKSCSARDSMQTSPAPPAPPPTGGAERPLCSAQTLVQSPQQESWSQSPYSFASLRHWQQPSCSSDGHVSCGFAPPGAPGSAAAHMSWHPACEARPTRR